MKFPPLRISEWSSYLRSQINKSGMYAKRASAKNKKSTARLASIFEATWLFSGEHPIGFTLYFPGFEAEVSNTDFYKQVQLFDCMRKTPLIALSRNLAPFDNLLERPLLRSSFLRFRPHFTSGHPRDRELLSKQVTSFLGAQVNRIRATWPAHRRIRLFHWESKGYKNQ
jgi:hypothetical protein